MIAPAMTTKTTLAIDALDENLDVQVDIDPRSTTPYSISGDGWVLYLGACQAEKLTKDLQSAIACGPIEEDHANEHD